MINKYAGMEYEDVVRQYADDITRLCVVWTQNEEAAKDCFQNTFLKLYQTEQTFREEEHIKALRKLPFRYREVIVLYYYEEYGTGEIAKMLHTSVNTVKSRLRRGREKIAAIMKN